MKKDKISSIISRIDEKYTEEATAFALNDTQETVRRRSAFEKPPLIRARKIRWAVLAACLVTFIVLGSAAAAFAVEAKEYRTAATFFEENGLSTEGLTRSEIKAVYRDITTKSFTNEKTAEVLHHAVPGWEIEQEEPKPEELAALWDRNVRMNTITASGVSYRIDSRYVFDEGKGYEVFEKAVFECYRDAELIWSAEFSDFYIENYAKTKEGVIVWGQGGIFSSGDTTHAWIACVDNTGKTVWQKRLEHAFKNEYVASVLNNGDGTLAVISRGDLKYLCLSCYDADGTELSFFKNEVGNFGIRNAARLGDGYIVQLWNQNTGDTALLCKMDREGVLSENFSYEADDCDYYITDMIEYEGRVYLSAYAVPKQKDEGGRHEIANVLDYVFAKGAGGADITSEELTPIVRDNYTAILLLCDPEGGAPENFYSVKGSLGGKLSVNGEDKLEWDVESVTSTFFSPATSSFTIGGSCKVFKYTFDKAGDLTGQTDTGDLVPYRR